MRKHTILLIMLMLGLPVVVSAQGLKFTGSEQQIDKRTSYDVFESGSPEFHGRMEISFDLSFYPVSEIGYIVRIRGEKPSDNIFNLFYDGQGDNLKFSLNEEGRYTLIKSYIPKISLEDLTWIKVRLSFDFSENSLTMAIGDSLCVTQNVELPDEFSPIIQFGRSEHVIDVPSFAIRNLRVGGDGRKPSIFPLDESTGTVVHDGRGKAIGRVSNPEWLMNDAYEWKEVISMNFSDVACAGYNHRKREIYYFNRDSIYLYNIKNGSLSKSKFVGECPVLLQLGASFVDAMHDRIYAYEVYYSHADDSVTVARLDLNTLEWAERSREQLPTQLHHHGTAFDAGRARLNIFGGFGNQRYNGNFYSYDLNSGHWYTLPGLSGDKIAPRYFTSLAYDSQTDIMYLYGGMGNESGEQVVGRKYFYDLYELSLGTGVIRKLWNADFGSQNVVPVRNMILSGDGYFYTLCYPESHSYSFLQMFRFSIENGATEAIANTIPIKSDKITTNANLYYDRQLEKMIATVQEFDDNDKGSVLKVFTLSLPSVTDEAFAAYYEKFLSGKSTHRAGVIVLLCIMLVLIVAAVVTLVTSAVHRGRALRRHISEVAGSADGKAEMQRSNALYLFGTFETIDSDGHDITASFTHNPMTALCLIVKYTVEGNGISSKKLSAVIWPDKTEDKVKNSRGVMINNLRKSLSPLKGVEIVFENGYYRLECGKEFYCDYMRFNQILSEGKADDNIDEIISILSRGKFMAFTDDPIFDSFKERVEEKVESFASAGIVKMWEQKNYNAVVRLADIIFMADPFNDQAIAMLVCALNKLKRPDEARLRYQAFVSEYRKAYDAEYLHTYVSLIASNIHKMI